MPYSVGRSRFFILPTPTDGLAAWKSSSLPPMEPMTMNAACRAGPVALSVCTCRTHLAVSRAQQGDCWSASVPMKSGKARKPISHLPDGVVFAWKLATEESTGHDISQ